MSSLKDAPAAVFRGLLVTRGLYKLPSTTGGVLLSANVGSMPDDGTQCICVYDTSGYIDGRLLRTGETVEHLGVQIRTRSSDYPTGWGMANGLALVMDGIFKATVIVGGNSYVIESASRTSAILHIGQEEKNRMELFTLNAILSITQN